MEDACKRAGKKIVIPSEDDLITDLCGAIMKSLDVVKAYDSIPRIVLDDYRLSTESIRGNSSEIVLFIDYTSVNTKVSYIHVHDEQLPDSTDIKHIIDWPGQSSLNRILPTTEVMLIPSMRRIQNCRYETDKFSNNLNGNIGRRIFSLKENTDHNKLFLEHTQGGGENYEYYTFKKSKRGIIWYIHRHKQMGKKLTHLSQNGVTELKIAQNNVNPCVSEKESDSVKSINTSFGKNNSLYRFTVTQERISFQEFSTMFFEYMISFLHNHLRSKICAKDIRFRYCITRDSSTESDGFKLSDENIYNIASECGIISDDTHRRHNLLLVLERVEATAIYCRKLINSIDTINRTSDLGFMQLQLNTDRCLLLINRAPFFANKDDQRQVEESWSAIYKYSKSATFPFNFMDNTCENLWIHIQRHQHNLLKRCERHRLSNLFFNSRNMSVFNKLLRVFFSTATLDLLNGDKVHKIDTCNSGQEGHCCCILIANMDILQFGLIPAINTLVSKIHSRISNQHFIQELNINNILIMGTILFCRYQKDHEFLEELLLMNLRKLNSSRLNDITLHHKIKNTQVTKVDGKEKGKSQNVYHDEMNDEESQDVLTRVALRGSIMYGLNPKDQVFERFATNTYGIGIKTMTLNGDVLNYHRSKVSDSNGSIDVEESVNDNKVNGDFELTDTESIKDVSMEGDKLLEGTGYVANDEDEYTTDYNDIFDENKSFHGYEDAYVTYEQQETPIKVTDDMVIPIIRKGTLLESSGLIEEEISTSFSMFNCPKAVSVQISLFISEVNGSDRGITSLRDFESVTTICGSFDCMRSTYPIIFKTRLSQTGSYKFWIEYGEHIDEEHFENNDTAQNLKTEHDTCPVLEFKFYNTDNVTCRYYERPIPCGLCPKKFKTKDYAKRHERTHIPSSLRAKFECTLCDKHYTSNRDLKRHNETHLVETERKMHQCILCEKSFGRKSALKDHEQTHLPESERVKFTCSTCEKSFKWKKHLHRHNKTHSINIDV
ncbi:unnamed protein product [Mucor hiemalis]